MINHRYPVPFLPVSGSVLNGASTTVNFGDLYDLAGSVSVGIYDADTQAIATGTGNGRTFFIGYSSEHTRDNIDKFMFGAQLPKGNAYWTFRGEDVISFEYSDPTLIKEEKWVLGYDGSAGCNETVPKFECDKVYGIRIHLSGSPTFRRWAKVLTHEVFTDPICCSDDLCATGCLDNFVDCERITKELAEKINNHVELKQMGVRARYISNTFAAATPNMNKYQISVTDDGSETAMALVKQTAGPDSNITRISRIGQVSTYEVCAASSPSDYQPPSTFAVPDECGVCPAGTTTVPAGDVYLINRPLDGSEDFSTAGTRQTYADTLKTAYAPAEVFDGATDVDPVTNRITVTAHGWPVGVAVVYSNGGGTTVVGLTNGATYYIESVPTANTVTLAATKGGAVVDITADGVGASHSLTPVATATFVSENGSVAVIRLSVPSEFPALAEQGSDSVVFSNVSDVTCTIAAPSPIAWTDEGDAYRMFRTMCITLPRKDCDAGSDRLAELEAYYANNPFYKADSLEVVDPDPDPALCADTYNLQQWSKGCMEDGCLAYDTAFFTDFGGYENALWEVVLPTPAVYDATKKCGIEIVASVPEKFIDDCEFELSDFYETEPIHLEVSWIHDTFTGFPDNCDMASFPKAKRTKRGQVARQSGDWVLREYIKSGAYEVFGEDYGNPKLRRVLDSQRRKQVDRAQNYRMYYLQFKVLRQNHNFDQVPEVAEAMFAFPAGDPKSLTFENAVLSPLSKFGVVLKERK